MRLSGFFLAETFLYPRTPQHLQKTPTLIVHGTTGAFCSPENAERANNMIEGKKDLEWITTTNHIELYDSKEHVDQAVNLVSGWMHESL